MAEHACSGRTHMTSRRERNRTTPPCAGWATRSCRGGPEPSRCPCWCATRCRGRASAPWPAWRRPRPRSYHRGGACPVAAHSCAWSNRHVLESHEFTFNENDTVPVVFHAENTVARTAKFDANENVAGDDENDWQYEGQQGVDKVQPEGNVWEFFLDVADLSGRHASAHHDPRVEKERPGQQQQDCLASPGCVAYAKLINSTVDTPIARSPRYGANLIFPQGLVDNKTPFYCQSCCVPGIGTSVGPIWLLPLCLPG